MLGIYKKIITTGLLTEKFARDKSVPRLGEPEADELGGRLKASIDQCFAGSLHIRQVDAGSCNGCELEIHALNNAYYDIERFGVHFVASPRHADVLLVTGPVSHHMEAAWMKGCERFSTGNHPT